MTVLTRMLVPSLLVLSGCAGGPATPGESPVGGCQSGTLPVGHWIGEWQTFALAQPDLVRAGTIDLVVAASGRPTGSTAESDNPDLGTLSGTVKPTGEFSAKSVVLRSGHEAKYELSGTVACEGAALAGAGTSAWSASDKASLKLRLQRAQ